MEKSKEIKCSNGHPAMHFCVDQGCSQSSIICQNKDCQFWKNHQFCFAKVLINLIRQRLNEKGQSIYLGQKDPVVIFYQSVIKSFTVALDSYKASMEKKQLMLVGRQRQLMRMLEKGYAEKIGSELVLDVIQSLRKDKHINVKQLYEQVQKELALQKITIDKILSQVNEKIIRENIAKGLKEQKVRFSFLKGKNQQITIINNKIHANLSKIPKFVLLQPSLNPYLQTQTFRFKLINKGLWIAFGVCVKQIIISKDYFFKYTESNHGAYMMSNNGYCWSSTDTKLNHQKKSFEFTQGDILNVVINFWNKTLTFCKQQSEQKFELGFEHPPNTNLNMCMVFTSKETVEYLEQE